MSRFTSAFGGKADVIRPKADIEDAGQKACFAQSPRLPPGCRPAPKAAKGREKDKMMFEAASEGLGDVSGAGDTFLAAMVLARAAGLENAAMGKEVHLHNIAQNTAREVNAHQRLSERL